MSRIGKKPIQIPKGVEVKVEGQKVYVKGPKGEISIEIRPEIKIELKNDEILIFPQEKKEDLKKIKAFWGLSRILIANMVEGVTNGFEKKLEIKGVGFKAEALDNMKKGNKPPVSESQKRAGSGKGDMPRKVNNKIYEKNYDQIKWRSKQ